MSPDQENNSGATPTPEEVMGAAQDLFEKATGMGGMIPGGGSIISSGVPAATLVKFIHWQNGAWKCQSFGVRLFRRQEKEYQPIEIDPKAIKFEAKPDYLEMGEPQKQEKAWIVPIKVKEGIQIAPAGSLNQQEVTYQLGEEVRSEPPAASDLIEVKVMVTVPVKVDAPLAAATALGGMIPGGESLVSAGLPALELKKEITYLVQPPQVAWRKFQNHPIRLDDLPPRSDQDLENLEEDPERVVLRSAPLPPGWQNGITVESALSQTSKKLRVQIARIEPAEAEENCLEAWIKVASQRRIYHPVESIGQRKDVVNAHVELIMITRSKHLGVQVQKGLMLSAQALDIAVYYRNQPAERHEWAPADHFFTSDLAKVAVIPLDKLNNPPDICRLGVALKILPNWSEPIVHWYLEEAYIGLVGDPSLAQPALDDKLAPEAGVETMYQSPSSVVWERGGKPHRRKVICMVGGGEENRKEPVPEHKDLYFAVPIKTEIDLAQRSRRARLKIRLGPKNLLQGKGVGDLTLKDPEGLEKSLIREFTVDIDFF
jgi:hypothetical protein